MKMRTVFQAAAFLAITLTGESFSPLRSSAFTGRVTSVCSREELTTELSSPSCSAGFRPGKRVGMSMPPFLKKLGLKKPSNKEDEETNASVAILDNPSEDDSSVTSALNEECVVKEEEELSETQKLLKQVKEAGTAGVISYALWELGFWALSVPVCIFGYYEVTGHFPDLSNSDDLSKLGAEAFAFVNFARFAVPLRIGLALSTTPWIQENVVDKFIDKKEEDNCEEP
mmetsp:Transcript_16752/g.23717  ORF Transcript_16752/g.23717 Transcript_16752/m.23717 type:complete len:228 (+) Transcript_16752:83-766(+)